MPANRVARCTELGPSTPKAQPNGRTSWAQSDHGSLVGAHSAYRIEPGIEFADQPIARLSRAQTVGYAASVIEVGDVDLVPASASD